MSAVARVAAAVIAVGAVLAAVAGVATVVLWAAPARAAAGAPARGAVRVITHVTSPGFPAFPLVVGGVIYEGTYSNPNGDSIPSHVFAYSGDGRLLRSYVVHGQDLSKTHGVQVATVDARGNLILLEDDSGVILRLNPRTGAQAVYGSVADLPTCSSSRGRQPCSPALVDLTPEPDYATWGPDGSLYITDYQQAVIWRVPPGGGRAQVWLASPALDGALFGTAGLVMLADHHTLMFDQASNAGLGTGAGNPTTGKLYTVPVLAGGRPGSLRLIWQSAAAAAPDGFALSRAGDVYMALVGPTANDVVEISPAGRTVATFGTPVSGADGTSVPFDEPSGVSFLGTELVVANQSYLTGDTAHMALLGVGTGEPGASVYVPHDAGVPPGAARHVKRTRRHHARRHRRRHRPRDRDHDGDHDAA